MLETTGIILKKELLIVFGIILWGIYFVLKLIKNNGNINKKLLFDCIFKLALIIYLTLLIGVTLFPIRLPRINMNINPVINMNMLEIFNYGFNKYAILNIVGNLVLLAPLSTLLYLNNFNKFLNVWSVAIISFIISLSIESLQYLEAYFKFVYVPRATDILDLILNTLGGLLGYFIFRLYQKSSNHNNILKS